MVITVIVIIPVVVVILRFTMVMMVRVIIIKLTCRARPTTGFCFPKKCYLVSRDGKLSMLGGGVVLQCGEGEWMWY